MGDFEIGDQVETLDDVIGGVVIRVSADEITIETEDGFLLDFEPSQLVKIPGNDAIRVSNREAAQDLHIHQLTDSTKGMSNYEMLNLQLDTAKRQLEFAIRKRIQKVVFIHGVGEGVLREELYTLFRRYDNLKYYDAEYQKYGHGATEVYIFQNGVVRFFSHS
jgi:dsDNA-specific endonuclease/ATPase MutS2